MEKKDICIAKGNTKLGKVPNVSLTPCGTCPKDAPCRKQCYALKSERQYKETRAARKRNTLAAVKEPAVYFGAIADYLTKKQPMFFRWHVAGDCPTFFYAKQLITLCAGFPDTKFLLFTKRYDWFEKLRSTIPSNLQVVFSMWNNYGPETTDYPRAWMLDPKNPDTRIPKTALACPGNCETCNACWSLTQVAKDVVFEIH